MAHVQCHGNINTVARTGEEFSHANARLIAAAPDLLAACEDLLRRFGFTDWDSVHDAAAVDQARAAVAKAKGG